MAAVVMAMVMMVKMTPMIMTMTMMTMTFMGVRPSSISIKLDFWHPVVKEVWLCEHLILQFNGSWWTFIWWLALTALFITTVNGLLCGEGQLHPQVTPHQESAKTPRSLSLHLCGTQATSYIASQYCSTKWTCKVHGFGFGSWAVSCDQILCRIKNEFASW